jgi:hypothetical protein
VTTLRHETPEEYAALRRQGEYEGSDRGLQWLSYAGTMLGLAGGFNLIKGVVALADSTFYTHHGAYVVGDVRLWGWIVLVGGVFELVASFAIFVGSQLARWFGVGVAGLNALVQLFFIPATPVWALAAFALDMLVIYALVVHGRRPVT